MEGVPVRVHDQCLTSEVLGSLRCDCKQQLELALDYITEHGGCVIYMQQVGGWTGGRVGRWVAVDKLLVRRTGSMLARMRD